MLLGEEHCANNRGKQRMMPKEGGSVALVAGGRQERK